MAYFQIFVYPDGHFGLTATIFLLILPFLQDIVMAEFLTKETLILGDE